MIMLFDVIIVIDCSDIMMILETVTAHLLEAALFLFSPATAGQIGPH